MIFKIINIASILQSEAEYKKSVNAIYSFIGTVQINQYQGRKQVNFVIDEIVYA